MSEFSYVFRHIPGAENHWGDLRSRLRYVGGGAAESGEEVSVCVRSIAVVASTDVDCSFPSMGKIRDRQDIYTDGKAVLDSPLGSVVRRENGLYRVVYGGMQVYGCPPLKGRCRYAWWCALICKKLDTGEFVLQYTAWGVLCEGRYEGGCG